MAKLDSFVESLAEGIDYKCRGGENLRSFVVLILFTVQINADIHSLLSGWGREKA